MKAASTLALAGTLALAACAEQPSGPPQPAFNGPAPGGTWVVTDAFASGANSAGAGRLVGQPVRLDADIATAPGGATCDHPVYFRHTQAEAEFLGAPSRMAEFPALARTLAVTEVRCGTDAFGRYAAWPDGSLLVHWDGAVLRLDRATAVALRPPPVTQPVMVAPPPAPPPVAAEAAAPPPPAGDRLYLASYRGETTARRGWTQLAQASATLAKLSPTLVAVDLGAKGHYIRLFAVTHGTAEAKRVCRELKRMLPECGVRP